MKSDLSIAFDVWSAVRSSIVVSERPEVADIVVGMLIDSGYDASDIKHVFRDDVDISKALKYYSDSDDDNEVDESMDDYEIDDDDDEWN